MNTLSTSEASYWISHLRSVEIALPDVPAAEAFFTSIWNLEVVARQEGAVYFRGSGPDHHLLAIHPSPVASL